MDWLSGSAATTEDESEYEQHEKHEEENLRDACGGTGDSTEPEDSRNDCDLVIFSPPFKLIWTMYESALINLIEET